jgi:hypothetical protein
MIAILALEGVEHLPLDEAATVVAHLVEALSEIDLAELQTSQFPAMYDADVVYEESKAWADVATIVRTGRGSCQSLSAWRIAEARLRGYVAQSHVVVFAKDRRIHVQVTVNGQLEDPSALVGRH